MQSPAFPMATTSSMFPFYRTDCTTLSPNHYFKALAHEVHALARRSSSRQRFELRTNIQKRRGFAHSLTQAREKKPSAANVSQSLQRLIKSLQNVTLGMSFSCLSNTNSRIHLFNLHLTTNTFAKQSQITLRRRLADHKHNQTAYFFLVFSEVPSPRHAFAARPRFSEYNPSSPESKILQKCRFCTSWRTEKTS